MRDTRPGQLTEAQLIHAHGGLDPDPLEVERIDWTHVPMLALSMRDQATAAEVRRTRRRLTLILWGLFALELGILAILGWRG